MEMNQNRKSQPNAFQRQVITEAAAVRQAEFHTLLRGLLAVGTLGASEVAFRTTRITWGL